MARWLLCALFLVGCGDDDGMVPPDPGTDSAMPDAGVDAFVPPPSTDHCEYEAPPPTARAGGEVSEGALQAGAAEGVFMAPVGSALGAYTARIDFLGDIDPPDRRFNDVAGTFTPSIGVESFPRVKALALTAGDETVVIVKVDVALADEVVLHRVEQRLEEANGQSFAGKVLFATSHTHSAFSQYTSNSILWVGLGRKRNQIADALVETMTEVAQSALDARQPAQMGIATNAAFDPDDTVTRDRRSENDEIAGGPRKDDWLHVLRVDATDGSPIAIAAVFGMHPTVLDADNLLASTDASGTVERAIEENFEDPVVVMHLQGAGGDVSPVGSGGIRCDGKPCYQFARAEMVGRNARDFILTAWSDAGEELAEELAVEMVTRHIPLGPDPDNFVVRDGALRYGAWDGFTRADGEVFGADGAILSPLDEFNAPYGAALCGESNDALFPQGQLPGTRSFDNPYRSCIQAETAAPLLGGFFVLPFEPMPACATTRTTVSALRLGDHLVVTVPGEPITLFTDEIRAQSPVDENHTIVVGFAQDHVGYMLTAEDWLARGYEPSINVWGPLEGEYIGEQIVRLMPLALTSERENGNTETTRWNAPPADDTDLPTPDTFPRAGEIEDPPWERLYVRGGEPLPSAQPPGTIARLESAIFAWIGEDPVAGTPRVTLERDVGEGVFAPVERRSGRVVVDHDLLLFHTPDPLIRESPDDPRTHRWAVEWQAVTWWGSDADAVADRIGVPAGRYRFRIEGTTYLLASDPFEVQPATMGLEVTREGDRVRGVATFHAPDGWRLLHPTLRSNEVFPANGEVEIRMEVSDGEPRTETVALDAEGGFEVDVPSNLTTIQVVDRFGNAGTWSAI
ncbi:MAG: neutral/alkaline non-lysosomal ceramidase N-terminal domain-containing protein [Myxococcota bacterium]